MLFFSKLVDPVNQGDRGRFLTLLSEHKVPLKNDPYLTLSIVSFCCQVTNIVYLEDIMLFTERNDMSMTAVLTDIEKYPLVYTLKHGDLNKFNILLFFNVMGRIHPLQSIVIKSTIMKLLRQRNQQFYITLLSNDKHMLYSRMLYERACLSLDRIPILQFLNYIGENYRTNKINIANAFQEGIPVLYRELRNMLIFIRLCPTGYYPTIQELFFCIQKCFFLPQSFRMLGSGSTGVAHWSVNGCHQSQECPRTRWDCVTGINKLMTSKDSNKEYHVHKRIGLQAADPEGIYHSRLVHRCQLDTAFQLQHPSGKLLTHGLIYEYGGITFSVLYQKYPRAVLFQALLSLADCIHYLNTHNIIHMDIKPDNIVCRFHNGNVHCRLIDFGLSVNTSTYPARLSPIFHRVYIWPFETMFLSSVKLSNPMSYIRHYLSKCPTAVPVDINLYKRTATDMFNTQPLSKKQLYNAVYAVDRFQFGLILSKYRLLGTNHHWVKKLLDPTPSNRPLLTMFRTIISSQKASEEHSPAPGCVAE